MRFVNLEKNSKLFLLLFFWRNAVRTIWQIVQKFQAYSDLKKLAIAVLIDHRNILDKLISRSKCHLDPFLLEASSTYLLVCEFHLLKDKWQFPVSNCTPPVKKGVWERAGPFFTSP
jgi:hypothetical protein